MSHGQSIFYMVYSGLWAQFSAASDRISPVTANSSNILLRSLFTCQFKVVPQGLLLQPHK